MMVYDNQLDLVAGGDDVARGLVVVNLVQDWWEAAAARYPDIQQETTTLTTTANQETTTWPTALKRLDELWMLDSNSRQVYTLEPIVEVGGHTPSAPWPLGMVFSPGATGAPRGYYAKGHKSGFFWDPIPNAVYTLRAYGLLAQADYTAAANTLSYEDDIALVVAPHATSLMRMGLERDISKVQVSADAAFTAVIKSQGKAVRVESASRWYSDYHDT